MRPIIKCNDIKQALTSDLKTSAILQKMNTKIKAVKDGSRMDFSHLILCQNTSE